MKTTAQQKMFISYNISTCVLTRDVPPETRTDLTIVRPRVGGGEQGLGVISAR